MGGINYVQPLAILGFCAVALLGYSFYKKKSQNQGTSSAPSTSQPKPKKKRQRSPKPVQYGPTRAPRDQNEPRGLSMFGDGSFSLWGLFSSTPNDQQVRPVQQTANDSNTNIVP
jgi:hypothetical protein